jgi:hypothetical protein
MCMYICAHTVWENEMIACNNKMSKTTMYEILVSQQIFIVSISGSLVARALVFRTICSEFDTAHRHFLYQCHSNMDLDLINQCMNVCTVYASFYYFAFAHVSRASVLGVCTPLFLILFLSKLYSSKPFLFVHLVHLVYNRLSAQIALPPFLYCW